MKGYGGNCQLVLYFMINNNMILEEYKRRYYWTEKKTGKIKGSNCLMLKLKCDKCSDSHDRVKSHYQKMQQNLLFNKDYCNACWKPILNNRPERIENMKAGLRACWTLEKRKEQSIIVKDQQKKSGYMHGDNNPMKDPAIAKKVGKTRSEKFKDPAERKKYSLGSINAHIRGCYIGNTTRADWHSYTHSNGRKYAAQGTWELAFLKWLDENKLEFICHKGYLPYTDDNGVDRNYYPDFYVETLGGWIDVKSDYWYKIQKRKFEILAKQYDIKILLKEDLIKMGVDLRTWRK